jgi:pimeloyl-ACP methyl ester carboxylesterase
MGTGRCDEGIFRHRYVTVDGLLVHVVEAGERGAPAVFLLHGWPENWSAWKGVMRDLSAEFHAVAIDLPGIGDSVTAPPAYDKRSLAGIVGRLIDTLELTDVTLAGSDVGGQIVYAATQSRLCRINRAVIASVAIPGIDPWSEVVANPQIWHFAFHAVPHLPEHLVTGNVAAYFDFFFEQLSADPNRLQAETRKRFVDAYSGPTALHTGFEWYRAFARDARDNQRRQHDTELPVLYLRGREDRGVPLERYVEGLRSAGLRNARGGTIPDSGHFIALEQPHAFARKIREFARGETSEASALREILLAS